MEPMRRRKKSQKTSLDEFWRLFETELHNEFTSGAQEVLRTPTGRVLIPGSTVDLQSMLLELAKKHLDLLPPVVFDDLDDLDEEWAEEQLSEYLHDAFYEALEARWPTELLFWATSTCPC